VLFEGGGVWLCSIFLTLTTALSSLARCGVPGAVPSHARKLSLSVLGDPRFSFSFLFLVARMLLKCRIWTSCLRFQFQIVYSKALGHLMRLLGISREESIEAKS
jgi:hypothetical protein